MTQVRVILVEVVVVTKTELRSIRGGLRHVEHQIRLLKPVINTTWVNGYNKDLSVLINDLASVLQHYPSEIFVAHKRVIVKRIPYNNILPDNVTLAYGVLLDTHFPNDDNATVRLYLLAASPWHGFGKSNLYRLEYRDRHGSVINMDVVDATSSRIAKLIYNLIVDKDHTPCR